MTPSRLHTWLAPLALAFFMALLPKEATARDFYGYYCTDDCSGHQAGWNWAERNGIEDEGDCGGRSQSFIQGCWAYVEQNYGDDGDEFDSLEDCQYEYGEDAYECEHLE